MAHPQEQTKQTTAHLERAQDRRFALHQALNEWGRNSFKYGSVDCCQFVAFIVYKITGKNHADGLEYESELGANALIAKYGDLVGVLTRAIGEQPNEAKTDGDPCVVDLDGIGQVAGIKYGQTVICLLQKGFIRLPDNLIIAGWNLCHR